MTFFLTLVAVVLAATLAGGLVRALLGPSPGDRMIGIQLFGTAGVAILLVLAEALSAPALRDVALVFALLASIVVVAFVQRGWVRREGVEAEEEAEEGEAP